MSSLLQEMQSLGIEVSWGEIQAGWELGCLSAHDVVVYAAEYWDRHPEAESPSLVGLASCHADETELIWGFLPHLKRDGTQSPGQAKRKWRLVLLHRTLREKARVDTLYRAVEGIYADFGYPKEMWHLVHLAEEEQHLSEEQATERFLRNLKSFIASELLALRHTSL